MFALICGCFCTCCFSYRVLLFVWCFIVFWLLRVCCALVLICYFDTSLALMYCGFECSLCLLCWWLCCLFCCFKMVSDVMTCFFVWFGYCLVIYLLLVCFVWCCLFNLQIIVLGNCLFYLRYVSCLGLITFLMLFTLVFDFGFTCGVCYSIAVYCLGCCYVACWLIVGMSLLFGFDVRFGCVVLVILFCVLGLVCSCFDFVVLFSGLCFVWLVSLCGCLLWLL